MKLCIIDENFDSYLCFLNDLGNFNKTESVRNGALRVIAPILQSTIFGKCNYENVEEGILGYLESNGFLKSEFNINL